MSAFKFEKLPDEQQQIVFDIYDKSEQEGNPITEDDQLILLKLHDKFKVSSYKYCCLNDNGFINHFKVLYYQLKKENK